MLICDIMSIMKKLVSILLMFFTIPGFAEKPDIVVNAELVYDAVRLVCSGISDEIGRVANISKTNTAVTSVGAVAAGGALVTGIKKSQEEEDIKRLVGEICDTGNCDDEENMIDVYFFPRVEEKTKKSKNLGNWRTGLVSGTIGTNLVAAILSGLNIGQSDLVQHVSACNELIKSVPDIENELRKAGINPNEYHVAKQLSSVRTWCNQIDVNDIEKIEKRMKGVMGTSIAGTAIGVVGVGTSAAANSSKYMDNKINMSEEDRRKEKALNTTANVMAGVNVATGAVETGLNISLITLTKKLMESAGRCEDILK